MKKSYSKPLRVVELFAGVGGFRVGLEGASDRYRVVWSNQWEPGRKKQEASDIYTARFGARDHVNRDIATVKADAIPDHDLLVGGFPCQDYSVAKTLNQSKGIAGKKGVLWWEIRRILEAKRPPYLFLENVDRLLKSPVKQRGRDFAVMLAALADLGYAVEWRVINAADYGMPQRRRRVFFLGAHERTRMAGALSDANPWEWIASTGLFAEAFPVALNSASHGAFPIEGDLAQVTKRFNAGKGATRSPFAVAGIMRGRNVWTTAVLPAYDGPRATLGSVLLPEKEVPASFRITTRQLAQWKYLKGSKREARTSKRTGFAYDYAEGAMVFPDPLDKPSRTIITGEGGSSPSRFKHVVRTGKGVLRRLTPIELERLNLFPDDHTKGASDARRAFFMGNALVTGIVRRVGEVLAARDEGTLSVRRVTRTKRRAPRKRQNMLRRYLRPLDLKR